MPNQLYDTLRTLATEQVNSASRDIDKRSVREILAIINNEDARVAAAVKKEIPAIEKAVNIIVRAFKNGGRLIYVGAGTSGRLGIVDAAECPPTFGTPPELVVGIIAGGDAAVFHSQEGAEDSEKKGASALRKCRITKKDVVCGIAASARTPFVIGAVKYARTIGAKTLYVTTNPKKTLARLGINVDVAICPQVGAEVIMGSTRMKSGTAQKLVLNMLTTAAMIRIGKVYGNLMVDLQMTNRKLEERSKRIVSMVTGADYKTATKTLAAADGHVKTAIVMLLADVDAKEAKKRLKRADGFVRKAVK
ncbi:MAG TPA: N-acetylmuramic acid 6-phosphate etherase [Candidatus Kapabacteria bacterium]|nr:N-acetylmuramic acid 6-phosphate etherase [Candidatus Kapabacteria bacterium]